MISYPINSKPGPSFLFYNPKTKPINPDPSRRSARRYQPPHDLAERFAKLPWSHSTRLLLDIASSSLDLVIVTHARVESGLRLSGRFIDLSSYIRWGSLARAPIFISLRSTTIKFVCLVSGCPGLVPWPCASRASSRPPQLLPRAGPIATMTLVVAA